MQGTTPRELIDWCAARLAHFKVPAAVHILPKMPTTGSGKILKTELRKMLGGTASGAAVGATPIAGPAAPHVSLAEAAAMLAAACGGGLSCQPLDAGMGAEWGRELLPDLTYVLVVEHAADIQKQASGVFGTGVWYNGEPHHLFLWFLKRNANSLASLFMLPLCFCRWRLLCAPRECAMWQS